MADQIDFDKIYQEFRGSYHEGHLKIQPSTCVFKNKKTSKSEQIPTQDIENLYWLKRSRGNCFKIVLKNGGVHRFDGLGENDFQKLDDYFNRTIHKRLEKTDLSVKGWNWGKSEFVGDSMMFNVDGKTAFEIPLRNVSNTNVLKNEAILQFHQNEDSAVSLMEIRFHLPANLNEAASDVDPAQEFIQKILSKADVQSASEADAICTLTELNCVTPRGRYDVKFFTDFVDLHGKTFDYKISYEHIHRLFLLPHKDGRQMYFVIAIDPPMKQGNTRYPFLIVLFNIEENITVDLTISDKTKEKFGERIEKLDKTIAGPYHEVVSRICRTVLDKKITVPGTFTTASGAKCYPCSFKASSGFLYPLERGFIFVNKPPLHILFSDISVVRFDRSQQGTRSFDFEIEHKNGTKFVFSGIEKTEQDKLQDFAKQKGINIAKSDNQFKSNLKEMGGGHELDAYAERMKAEGREKDEDDEDDSDEEDSDFKADSESDDDIEYDSNASVDTKSSDDESGGESKEKKKSSSKKASKGGSDEGSDGDEEEDESDEDDDDEDEDEDSESDGDSKKKKKPASSSSKKPAATKKPSESSKDKSKKTEKKSPQKRSSTSKDQSKKAAKTVKPTEQSKSFKSAEFIEDSGSDSN